MHCPTISTSIPLQPYPCLITIEKPKHIPVPPHPYTIAAGTSAQYWPRILLFFLSEFVEIYRYIDYNNMGPLYGI
jgi:hypothetical protein